MRRGGAKALSLSIAAGIALAVMVAPALAQVGQFDIPPEEAEKSIPELARQAGVQIIGPGEPLKSVVTPRVKGTFDVSAALEMMLKGTDLVVSRSAEGVILISPREKGCYAEEKRMPQELKRTTSIFALLVGALMAPSCHAQAANDTSSFETIVVTGFRNSLNKGLQLKQNDAGVVDTIVAEDIGKFPDSNLAESMQRVPGVALQRGDGGEGRAITVRGLGPIFTRTRINGMEASSAVSGTDVTGTNRGRGFDFSVFASELFQNLTVRKTYSADTDEGSLGATVDLSAPHPLDYKDTLTLAASAKASYNSLNDRGGPRLAGLASWKTDDDSFGVLLSAAYTKRRTREEGYSPANVLPANVDGGFCTPLGYATQYPANDATKGTNAQNCATGLPRTSDPAAYAAVVNAAAYSPRLPRYYRTDQNYDRLGLTSSVQWRPDDKTLITLDGLFSRYHVDRNDYMIQAHSFGRGVGNNGKPHTSIVEADVSSDGTVQYGKFNGVDLGSINTRDVYTSEFKQISLTASREVTPWLTVDGLIGYGRSTLDEPIRFDVRIDSNNANGFSFDFRGDKTIPVMNFGIDITKPSNFVMGPMSADGTVNGSLSGRQDYTVYDNQQYVLNAVATVTPWLKVRAGFEHRKSDFTSREVSRASAISSYVPSLPAGVTMADLTTMVTGFGDGLGSGIPTAWVTPDWKKFDHVLGLTSNVGNFKMTGPETNTSLGNNFQVDERTEGAYVQGEFDTDVLPIRLRGNIGVRWVETHQRSFGYVQTATPVPTTVERAYQDWLPTANITADLTDTFLLRASLAKVMARPDLTALSPSGGLNPTIRTVGVGNAMLDPIRADTVDLSAEWYFQPGSLLSVGFFYKDIKSYIQTMQRLIPFTQTGLPTSLLAGSQAVPDDLFTVTNLANTKGGPLKGIEAYYQQEFKFLPGFLENTGMLLNYTYVESQINYILNASTGLTTNRPLVGMSKNQYNATLYYEDEKLQIRGSANYRSGFVRSVPSISTNSDIDLGKATLFMDFSASYALSDKLRVSLEGANLTDQHTVLLVDSRRLDTLYDTHFGRTFTIGVSYRY
jgi:TonB-dependent receptor